MCHKKTTIYSRFSCPTLKTVPSYMASIVVMNQVSFPTRTSRKMYQNNYCLSQNVSLGLLNQELMRRNG